MHVFTSIPMARRTLQVRYLALYSHVLLLIFIGIWQFYIIENQPYSFTFILFIYLFPLCLPLWGVIRGKPYTHAWASFVVLFYFIHSVTVLYVEPEQGVYALAELTLSITMFTGTCLFARLRGRECGLGLNKLKDVMAEEKSHFERKY